MERRWGVLYLNVMQDASRYRQSALHMVADGKMTAEEAHIGKVDPEREAIEPPLSIDFRPSASRRATARRRPHCRRTWWTLRARGASSSWPWRCVRDSMDGRTDGWMDGCIGFH